MRHGCFGCCLRRHHARSRDYAAQRPRRSVFDSPGNNAPTLRSRAPPGRLMSLDGLETEVRIILAGEEAHVIEAYQVSIAMLTVPAKFSVVLGHGDVAKDLM